MMAATNHNWGASISRASTVGSLGDGFDVDDSVLDSLAEMVDTATAALGLSEAQFEADGGAMAGLYSALQHNPPAYAPGFVGYAGLDPARAADAAGASAAHPAPPMGMHRSVPRYTYGLPPNGLAPAPAYDLAEVPASPGTQSSVDGAYSWDGVQLVIIKHSVHKVRAPHSKVLWFHSLELTYSHFSS